MRDLIILTIGMLAGAEVLIVTIVLMNDIRNRK